MAQETARRRGGGMRRMGWMAWMMALISGCASGPLLDNPLLISTDPSITVENPVFVPGGPTAYGAVFERVLDVVSNYFEIAHQSRYDGSIESFPRIAPGYEQFWKPGSPDAEQRLLATFQTIRHRCLVKIEPANDGGFFINVKVFKELEDLPRPVRSTAGAASFRSDNTVERQFEVIDPTVFESQWIPLGEDTKLEQVLLQMIKKCM
jgi:hypothetical protein